MAESELLNKTFFYYPDANKIAMATNGAERLRIDGEGHFRLGESAELKDCRLTVQGETNDNTKFALKVTDLDGNNLLSVRNDGAINIGPEDSKGPLDVKGHINAGNSDIYFTKTDHNHTRKGNVTGVAAIENAADYGALMILGRFGTTKGRYVRLWDYLQVNGGLDVTNNVGLGTDNPGNDRLRIKGVNTGTTFALRVTNSDDHSLFGVRNNGEIYIRSLPSNTSAGIPDVGFYNNKLVVISSSKRFKTDIQPLQADFTTILNAVPKSFVSTEFGEKSFGFIAEEFHNIGLRQLVSYDENNLPFSINYKLIPIYLLEIIKNHQLSIEKLKTENETLKAELYQNKTELTQKIENLKLQTL